MPSTILWRGDAPAVAQVLTITVSGAWATADTATLTSNGKSVTFTVGATQTIAAVVAGLVAAWNASTVAEHAEITAAAGAGNTTVVLTADTAGVPFTVTTSEVTAGDGELSDPAATVANSGPADLAIAANFQGGVLPGNGDTLVFEKSANSCLYNLDSLDSLTSLLVVVKQSYTGLIGLPKQHSGSGTTGYVEYRPRYLKANITALDIGGGDGGGSSRLMFDCSATAAAVTIHDSGSAQMNGDYPILIHNTATGSSLRVNKGSVGIAIYAGETANLDAGVTLGYVSNQKGDATVTCGSGVTLANVTKTGGSLTIESNVGTVVNYEGDLTVSAAATATSITLYGGTLYDESTGTFTAVVVHSGATYDYRRGTAAKTITTLDLKRGSNCYDPAGLVAITNGAKWMNCDKYLTKPDVAWNPV